MDLSARSTRHEVMDDAAVDIAVYRRCLADLAAVNRVTFTHRPTLRWLREATAAWPAGAAVSVLDVGYGQGDLLRAIWAWGTRLGLRVRLSGVDLNPRSAKAAADATPPEMRIDYLTGDVFDYAPAVLPDFIVSSQFTHHLDDDEVVRFLLWLERNSRCGWHIADLHRHAVPYYGFRVLARLMGWHRIVREDGTISIARSFRRAEWAALLARAGLDAKISWHFAFRLCVGRIK